MLRGATCEPSGQAQLDGAFAPPFGSSPAACRAGPGQTALAWVLGSAPKAVLVRLKILLWRGQLGVGFKADDDFVTSGSEFALFMSTSLYKNNEYQAQTAIIKCLGSALVEIGGLLEAVRRVQQARLLQVVADQLQAHRHAGRRPKPTGTLMAGRPANEAGRVKMSAR